MARSISVKIPTARLVEELETHLAKINKEIEEYPAKREQYEADLRAYDKAVADFVFDYLRNNPNALSDESYNAPVRVGYTYNNRIELSFSRDLPGCPVRPVAPEQPNQREHFGRDYTTRKELIEKNLRILRMTEQETVSASTYGAVMEIL